MEKNFYKKIISTFIISSVLISQVAFSRTTEAANTLPWNNPNKSTSYTFKVGDVLNSRNVMTAVGCTGIVNKVSKVATNYVKTLAMGKTAREALRNRKKAIESLKKGGEATVGAIDATALGTSFVGPVAQSPTAQTTSITRRVSDFLIDSFDVAWEETQKNAERTLLEETKFREECLNGLAYSLAKTQLTAMTRSTMNWVNTGFNGDPMYVRNMDSFLNSIKTDITTEEVDFYKDPENSSKYPFGRDTARSFISKYQTENNFRDSIQQDLTNYLDGDATIQNFSNDFSVGGWDGWLALTQKSQNNPLGFGILTSQNLAEKKSNAIQNIKDELTQTGFLSQKKCVEYSKTSTDVCTKYEVVTPGSLIKDKVSYYLNSPERQLELTDTINEGLNALFSSLLSKFQNEGLSSIKTSSEEIFTTEGGFGSNSLEAVLGGGIDIDISLMKEDVPYNNTNYSKFDITKDLGDIYTDAVYMGKWDASTNTPELLPNTGIKNSYYNVSVGGLDMGLLKENYTWKIGERAFFDGEKWQVGLPKQIIEKKGIIHVQQDYIDATIPYIKEMPSFPQALSKLDYCIPGPNLNWEQNSEDTKNKFSSLMNNLDYSNVRLWRHQQLKEGKVDDAGRFWDGNGNKVGPGYEYFDLYLNGTRGSINTAWQMGNSYYYYEYPKSYTDNKKTDFDIYKDSLASTKMKNAFMNLFKISFHNENPLEKKGKLKVFGEFVSNPINDAKTSMTDDAFGETMFILENLVSNTSERFKRYKTEINKIFGDSENFSMRKEYNEIPTIDPYNPTVIKNPNYLPMATEGLILTKNLVEYGEDIKTAKEEYYQTVVDARINIVRLKEIQEEVNKIIQAAQLRREAKLMQDGIFLSPECLEQEGINYIAPESGFDVNFNSDIIR